MYNDHQTEHLCAGFIFDPRGQLNSLAKSSLFCRVPMTLNLPGAWLLVMINLLSAWSRYFEHQSWPKLMKNSWPWLKGRPGRVGSSPLFLTQRTETNNKVILQLLFEIWIIKHTLTIDVCNWTLICLLFPRIESYSYTLGLRYCLNWNLLMSRWREIHWLWHYCWKCSAKSVLTCR